MESKHTVPEFHVAQYREQRIPHYRGNPLIEALPPALDESGLLEEHFDVPEFSDEQRSWSIPERMQMLAQLSNFMVPMPRHFHLAYSLEAMMRQGYVGRSPRSAASHRIFGKLHDGLQLKSAHKASLNVTPQISSSLIGLSGMGKTTTIKRLLSRIPKVIHHPDLGIYQIPYLHIETPYNGASVIGLAHSIFRKVDQLLPEADYMGQYANSRHGAEALMNHAARILHMHCVGLLVVDEIQNLENSGKNRQALMTLLVSASNELGVPILFVGTNKARRLLSMDFRQARRSIGLGASYWDKLKKGTLSEPCEWEDFLSILWRFQWVRNPIPLTQQLSDLLYDLSQGIVDIAIKLFAASQLRAILDGSETLTGVLIAEVAKRELAMIEPMINALRRNNIIALQQYDDIAPIALGQILDEMQKTYSGRNVPTASVRPDNELFIPTVASGLEAVGYEHSTALELAETVARTNAINVPDGLKKAIELSLSGPKRKKAEKKRCVCGILTWGLPQCRSERRERVDLPTARDLGHVG